MAKVDVLQEALDLGLDVSMDNTVAEIRAAIDEYLQTPPQIELAEAEIKPEKYEEFLESVEPKLRAIQANISYSVVAGVGRVVFQDLENTGNRFMFEDGVEWEEVSERLRTFLMEEK